MKKYEYPEIQVEKFEIEEIIATSFGGNGGNGENGTPDQEL